MPRAKTLSGQSLANAIYAITDKLEAEFAAEFIAQMRKLSRRKSLQELLDQIEGGYYSSVATIPTSLLSLQIDTSKLNAIARKAMGSAARITDEKIGLNIGFNVKNPTIIEAARNISVDLSTNLSQTSQKILDKVIGDAMEGLVTRREAVKIIESRVGLLPAHSDAVDRYYDTLIQSGATKANAKKLADKYADRLLRYRANTIARTEIARATGIGQTEFWRQAVADGSLLPDTKRVWTTSYDERVCEICGPMNNVEVGIFESWLTPNGFVDYPSAIHPNCRCSQGIAMSAAQKRLFIGKTDDEKFEQYALSKFNPNHDELGRFTFSSGGRRVSQMPKGKEKKPVMRFGDRVIDPSVIDIKSVESKNINGMTINIGMIGDKQHEAYAKYTSPKNGVTYDIISDRAGNTYAYIEGSKGLPHERTSKLEIIVDALGQGKHEIYEAITVNSHKRQGLASAMFEVSRTLLGGKFTPNALTAQGSEWWESISKFNPYHDELGRFTFAPAGKRISAKPKLSRRALGLKGKVSSLIRFSSAERKASVEKLATEGSSKLLMPPDANGIAQVLPEDAADKRYGKTVTQIKKSIAKLGVESISVTPDFGKGKNAKRQMQATAQALEEAKAMGISIDKLTISFTTALRDADGEYAGDQDKRAGDMVIDYTDDRRAKLIADKVANDSGPRILNAPTVAQTQYTSDYPVVTSQKDLVAKYTYGVAVHEIGHHYTYVNANNPNAKRQFGLETPAKYGTSDVYEMLAEGFTAWWLLGRSRVRSTQTFYKRWLPFVKVVLNGNDTGFGIPTPEALLKSMVRKTKVLNLLELSPTHPLMVYLTDGASIPDDIEKFNPYHDELGRFTFAPNGNRTPSQGKLFGGDATIDGEIMQHSGYESLPKPTNDLGVARKTGAPIEWLMPNSMHPKLAETYSEMVLEYTKNFNMTGKEFGILESYLEKLGFTPQEAKIAFEGLHARARIQGRMRRASIYIGEKSKPWSEMEDSFDKTIASDGGLDLDKIERNSNSMIFGGSSGDEIVTVNAEEGVVMSIFTPKDGRYKTQFETGRSGGVLSTRQRAAQELASFSLHPSLEPSKRPVYGQVHPQGFDSEIDGLASQYGRIALVMDSKTNGRTTWNEGDSLNMVTTHSELSSPTYHGNSDFTASSQVYGSGDVGGYLEAQIHGGVKKQDIKYIILPVEYKGSDFQERLEEVGVPSSMIVYVDEAETKDLSKKFMGAINFIPANAKLVAVSESSKLYSVGVVNGVNGKEHLGYVQRENGKIYKVNVDDVYSRGYWEQV